MPSTYSTSLRLELQATGENRTTWGTKADQTFNMIEDGIAGLATIAMANANYSLTTANGSLDEARNMMLNITGAHTAIRTLTIPTVAKTYIIRNATTGGFAVTVSNGTNTVSIGNGKWYLIWTDGTLMFGSPDLTSTYALLSQLADLSGVSNPTTARTNLGLVIGTDVQGYDAGLAALAANVTNGVLTQTANNVFTGRTVTGTANEVTVTNGDGVAGNPVIGLPTAMTLTGKTVTGLKVVDNSFSITDNLDTTKNAQFDLTGLTTGTTRTYTLPNATGTLVDLATTQALSNKSHNGPFTVVGGLTATTGTFSSNMSVTGQIVSGNFIYTLQNFISTTAAVVVSPTGAGTCYLRPNGAASGAGQMTVDANGDAIINGSLTVTG